VFAAVQDGNDEWRAISANDPAQQLDWASGSGGLSVVFAGNVDMGDELLRPFHTLVYFATRDELVALSRGCDRSAPPVREVAGSVSGTDGALPRTHLTRVRSPSAEPQSRDAPARPIQSTNRRELGLRQ
jgi:hypothetical protein